ncbi:hypothetical protein ACA910_003439 [Epithemia clementina (nom. ined.)]
MLASSTSSSSYGRPKKTKTTKKEEPTLPCSICATVPTRREWAALDGCAHQYCFDCISTWADRENLCPLCRQQFFTIARVHPYRTAATVAAKTAREKAAAAAAAAAAAGKNGAAAVCCSIADNNGNNNNTNASSNQHFFLNAKNVTMRTQGQQLVVATVARRPDGHDNIDVVTNKDSITPDFVDRGRVSSFPSDDDVASSDDNNFDSDDESIVPLHEQVNRELGNHDLLWTWWPWSDYDSYFLLPLGYYDYFY